MRAKTIDKNTLNTGVVDFANVIPLHDRVRVKLNPEEQQIGRIVLADVSKQKPRTGIVEAAGPGRWIDDCFFATQVKKGQRVLISPAVNLDYDDILAKDGRVIIQEADIMGVFE